MRWSCEPLVGGNWPSSLFTIWRELCQNKLFSSCLLWFTQVLPPHHNDPPPQLYCLCWSNLGQMKMKSWWTTQLARITIPSSHCNGSLFQISSASGLWLPNSWENYDSGCLILWKTLPNSWNGPILWLRLSAIDSWWDKSNWGSASPCYLVLTTTSFLLLSLSGCF